MFKARLSRKKLLTLEWTLLAILVYFSFCFFTPTPMGDNCIYGSSADTATTERNRAAKVECAPRDKVYEAYLFWNILKDNNTDPHPGGQDSKYEVLLRGFLAKYGIYLD